MASLAVETKDMGFLLEQVQDFTPTPMTVATIIYYTGLHPYTLRPVYTAKSAREKKQQHLFFFWHKRENHQQIKDKLISIGREDLIDQLIGTKKKYRKREIVKAKGQKRRGQLRNKKRK